MKILIANTLYFPEVVGGAEISTQILAEGLAAAGVEVSVVCATGAGEDRVETLNGVTVHYLRLANVYWPHDAHRPSRVMRAIWHTVDVNNVLMSRKLEKIIQRERPDVVSTSNLSCLSTGIWRIAGDAGARIVHTARDYYLICPTVRMFSGNKCCERQCRMCALYAQPKKSESARVDVAIGVSRHVLRQHLELGFFPLASQTCVVSDCYMPPPDGRHSAGAARATQAAAAPGAARRRGEPVRLGVLGRISPEKGIDLVLEQLLEQRQLNWRLHIGGTGNRAYEQWLKTTYADPRITFTGYVDAREFFSGIDILIVPSRWHEPFGRVTVEAYSHGIPVVGANSGGIPEVIEPRSALLFDAAHPETLVQKIRLAIALLDDPQFKSALLRQAQIFSPANMIEAYLGIYRQVLERGRRSGFGDSKAAAQGKIKPVA